MSLYDKPILTTDRADKVTPYALPFEVLDKQYAAQQQKWDTNRDSIAQVEDEILKIRSRPGVQQDRDYVQGVQSEVSDRIDQYIKDQLKGNYSRLDPRQVSSIVRDTMSKHQNNLSAIARNADIYDTYVANRDKFSQDGKVLELESSVLSKPTVGDDGIARVYSAAGVQQMLDWHTAMNSLFEKLGENQTVTKKIPTELQSDPSGKTAFLRGNLETIITSDPQIDGVVSNMVEQYANNTPAGQQQTRWYMKRHMENLLQNNPDMDPTEAEDKAYEQSMQDMRRALFVIGESKKGYKKIAEDIIMPPSWSPDYEHQLKLEEINAAAKARGKSGTGSTEEEGPTDVSDLGPEDITPTLTSPRSAAGSEFHSHDRIKSELMLIDSTIKPTSIDWSTPVSSASSYKEVEYKILNVGPDTDEPLWGTKTPGHQFYGKNSKTRGELQKLDDIEGHIGDENRANAKISVGGPGWASYKLYVEKQFGKTSSEYANIVQAEKNVGEGKTSLGSLRVSPFQIRNTPLGARIDIADWMMSDPDMEEYVNRSKDFLSEKGGQIAQYLSNYDRLNNKKAGLIMLKKQAAEQAGLSLSEVDRLMNSLPKESSKIIIASDEKFDEQLIDYDNSINPLSTSFSSATYMHDLKTQYKDTNIYPAMLKLYKLALDGPAALTASGFPIVAALEGDDVWRSSDSKDTVSKFLRRYLKSEGVSEGNINAVTTGNLFGPTFKSLSAIAELANKSSDAREIVKVKALSAKTEEMSKIGNPQILEYMTALDKMKNDWFYDGAVIHPDTHTTNGQKIAANLTDAIKNVVMSPNTLLFKRVSNSSVNSPDVVGTTEQDDRAYTFSEALQSSVSAAELGEKYKNDPLGYLQEQMDKSFDIINIGMDDKEDGLTLDINIGTQAWEVRNAKVLEDMLVKYSKNKQVWGYYNDAVKQMKASGGVSALIGDSALTGTTVYMKNTDKPEPYNGQMYGKGSYFIFQNGQKKFFPNMFQVVDWHIDNKEKDKLNLVEAGTVIAMGKEYFESVYPGKDYEKFKASVADEYNAIIQKAVVNKNALIGTGFNEGEVTYGDLLGTGKKAKYLDSYVIPDSDQSLFKDDEVVTDPNGKKRIKLQQFTGNNIVSKYSNRDIVVAAPMKKVLDGLDRKASELGVTLVITNSLRSIDEQGQLYNNKGVVYSPHMSGFAVDIRTTDTDGKAFKAWVSSAQGISWLQANNLSALYHKIENGEYHLDLRYNVPLSVNQRAKAGKRGFTYKDDSSGVESD